MRASLLHPCYWPEVRRGSERFIHDLAIGLARRGHATRVITSHRERRTVSEEEGVTVIRGWRPPGRRLQLGMRQDFLTHLPGSARELWRGDTDVAHALYMTDALVAHAWSARTGRPSVYSLMGIPDRPPGVRGTILSNAVRRADAVVALSAAAAAAAHEAFGADPTVIVPGVDLATFSEAGPRAHAPTVLCTSALEDQRKRGGLLLEAFELLRASVPDARLVLSRPGDPAAVAALGLDLDRPGVELAPLDGQDELVAAYSSAWVSVLPSVAEAFGLVLVEALACGRPVVGRAEGGVPEIVSGPEVGRLFHADDPRELADALAEALALSGEQGTAAACRARAEQFDVARCVEGYERLYEGLIGR
ncbi:MAG: glycosyltransferase family 4 protein [Thermoleophilaceae bacterium]|nr:glycosyltransferase family 4 protein [Thermoleophilaceae bacterium]